MGKSISLPRFNLMTLIIFFSSAESPCQALGVSTRDVSTLLVATCTSSQEEMGTWRSETSGDSTQVMDEGEFFYSKDLSLSNNLSF